MTVPGAPADGIRKNRGILTSGKNWPKTIFTRKPFRMVRHVKRLTRYFIGNMEKWLVFYAIRLSSGRQMASYQPLRKVWATFSSIKLSFAACAESPYWLEVVK